MWPDCVLNPGPLTLASDTPPTVQCGDLNLNKKRQAKCPLMCEMSVCGECVYNMYVK